MMMKFGFFFATLVEALGEQVAAVSDAAATLRKFLRDSFDFIATILLQRVGRDAYTNGYDIVGEGRIQALFAGSEPRRLEAATSHWRRVTYGFPIRCGGRLTPEKGTTYKPSDSKLTPQLTPESIRLDEITTSKLSRLSRLW